MLASLDRANERFRLYPSSLWPLPQPTFEGEGFTCHVLKIRGRQLDADPSDFFFSITKVTDWWNVDVGFEGVRECFFELLQLRGPSERTNDVHVDVIRWRQPGSSPESLPLPPRRHFARNCRKARHQRQS